MPTIISAENKLYEWLQVNYPLITNRYSMTSMMGMRVDFMRQHPALKVDLSKMRQLFLGHLAQLCHYPPQPLINDGFAVFMAERNTVNFYTDAIPALKQLSKNFTLATISNGNANVYETAAAKYISYAINAADVQKAKPDPKMFKVIELQSGFSAHQCLYIGDTYEHDIRGAKNAQWQCIWVNREQKEWAQNQGEAPLIIESLDVLL